MSILQALNLGHIVLYELKVFLQMHICPRGGANYVGKTKRTSLERSVEHACCNKGKVTNMFDIARITPTVFSNNLC